MFTVRVALMFASYVVTCNTSQIEFHNIVIRIDNAFDFF